MTTAVVKPLKIIIGEEDNEEGEDIDFIVVVKSGGFQFRTNKLHLSVRKETFIIFYLLLQVVF